MRTIGVIDIGSNSIKLLVASKGEDGKLVPITQTTEETRIGIGILNDQPRLMDSGMDAACHSVKLLKAKAEASAADSILVVATSAVREAINRDQFTTRLMKVTGLEVEVLSGREEAKMIGLGIGCDPEFGSMSDFYVIDLGGGSLEAIKFRDRLIEQAVSLPLGSVRLTEKFIADPEMAFRIEDQARIESHVRELIEASPFTFDLPAEAVVVVTGGTAAAVRLIRETMDDASPAGSISLKDLENLLSVLGVLALSERRRFPGLPPKRADIFPTALSTLLAVFALGDFDHCKQSFYNLRYGIAMRHLSVGS
jgi:exopolyphosphatase/guanosine-5'-triphosphate,3'-diphosphate pyrophosphatase